MKENDHIYLLERDKKLGLGTAYCTGFQWALKRDYDLIIQMDADLSHNPDDIPRLIDEAESSDLVIGSRYIGGVNVVNWPMRRLLLSYFEDIPKKEDVIKLEDYHFTITSVNETTIQKVKLVVLLDIN